MMKDAPSQSLQTGSKEKDQEVLIIFTTSVYLDGPVASKIRIIKEDLLMR